MTTVGDIELDALAGTIARGIASLNDAQVLFSASGWADELARYAARAVEGINTGRIEQAVRNLTIGQSIDDARDLAALAMRPGGFRLLGIVFCARHAPYGTDATFRYACRDCEPGSFRDLARGPDRRNVVTIEGTML